MITTLWYPYTHVHTDQVPPECLSIEGTEVFVFAESEGKASLTLSCDAMGDDITYAWFHDGEELNATLYVHDADFQWVEGITEGEFASRDGIIYYCTVSNRRGTARSLNITVIYACELVNLLL